LKALDSPRKMQRLDLSLPTAAENIALDEALLLAADEAGLIDGPLLRLWQSQQVAVVLGRSSRVQQEVIDQHTQIDRTPIVRRFSGGASVVIGPGCLMYSLLIDLRQQPHLRMLDAVHLYAMQGMLQAVGRIVPQAALDGTCDLVVDGRKVSGNALRVGREWTLYHGTLLVGFDLPLIDRYLKHPPREPAYRQGRSHSQFVANMDCDMGQLKAAVQSAWGASDDLKCVPQLMLSVDRLLQTRYFNPAWNLQR
jgi:lipoate-protein ligase A